MVIDRWKSARTISFGPWKAHRASRVLTGPAGTKLLDADAMELLFLIHANADEGVERDDIYERLWPHGGVAANTLARCVARLRHALDDEPQVHGYIETTFRHGDPTLVDPDVVTMRLPIRRWLMVWLALAGAVLALASLWLTRPR